MSAGCGSCPGWCFQHSDISLNPAVLAPCSIENEYGLRELPWVGPALQRLDLSRNVWLATHHACAFFYIHFSDLC